MRVFDDVSAALASYKVSIAVVGGAACGLFALRKFFAGGVYRSKARMDGKTVLITGANTGIGKETAKDLAKRGARVLMACRDKTRAEQAAEEVRQFSGNQDVHVYILDLSSLASVRNCAGEVKAKEKRLDVLINNAGLMCPYSKTEDGFEMQFGTNHLGHFLFTILLLDLLKASAPSRIVNVSSIGHERTGVTVNSLHPGFVRTDIQRHLVPGGSLLAIVVDVLYFAGLWLVMKDPRQGAQTNIYCAVAPELETVTGTYFCDCAIKEPAPHAKDDEAAIKLWTLSEKMVGLTG